MRYLEALVWLPFSIALWPIHIVEWTLRWIDHHKRKLPSLPSIPAPRLPSNPYLRPFVAVPLSLLRGVILFAWHMLDATSGIKMARTPRGGGAEAQAKLDLQRSVRYESQFKRGGPPPPTR